MQHCANPYSKSPGFTLTGLLITLSISAILLAIGIPSYRALTARNLQASEINSFVHYFHLARSLSITEETHHVLCPSNDGESCSLSSDWGRGFILYEDTNQNGTRDRNEQLQGVHQPIHQTDFEIQSSRGSQLVIYHGDGRPSGYNLTLTFCDPEHMVSPKAVIVNNMGRVQVSETRWNGAPLSCSG